MWGKHETCYRCRALEDCSTPNGKTDYRCGLGYSTIWTLSELIPTEDCDKPLTKQDLIICIKISHKLTALQKVEKLEIVKAQTKKHKNPRNQIGKIRCHNCNEVFEDKLPHHGSQSFPKKFRCPHCKSLNYMLDYDNGSINQGLSVVQAKDKFQQEFGMNLFM